MWIEKQVFRPLIRLAEDWVDKDILIELILEGKEGGKSSWIGFRITFSDKASPCSTSTKFKSRERFIAAVDKNLATVHNTVFENHWQAEFLRQK